MPPKQRSGHNNAAVLVTGPAIEVATNWAAP
jgi:hypothetical protein